MQAQSGGGKVDKSAILRFGLQINEQGGVYFDPASGISNPAMREVFDLIYLPAIRPTADGEGAPGWASEWTVVDPNTVEVTIAPGLKFSDGTDFDSAAVKGAWDRLLALNPANMNLDIQKITSIETPDDSTVVLETSAPVAQKLVDETLRSPYWLGIPSPASIAAGNVNTDPVGAGPYQLESYQSGGDIVLTKNPHWGGSKKDQRLAGVTFVPVASGPPAIAALQADSVDMIWNFTPDAIPTLEGGGFEITSKPGSRVFGLFLCATEGPLASLEARQALQYAINREAVNAAAFAGAGTPTVVPVGSTSPYYDKKLEKTYPYSVKKAKQAFEDAGIAEGTTFRMLTGNFAPGNVMGEIVQSELEKVGMEVELTQTPNLPADSARLKPDITAANMDPSLWRFAIDSTTTLNPCGWRSAEATAALATINDASKTPEEIAAAYQSIQEVLLAESPIVFLVNGPVQAAHTDRVKGLTTMNFPYGPQILSDVYMTK